MNPKFNKKKFRRRPFAWAAAESDEISFFQGDILDRRDHIDAGWMLGRNSWLIFKENSPSIDHSIGFLFVFSKLNLCIKIFSFLLRVRSLPSLLYFFLILRYMCHYSLTIRTSSKERNILFHWSSVLSSNKTFTRRRKSRRRDLSIKLSIILIVYIQISSILYEEMFFSFFMCRRFAEQRVDFRHWRGFVEYEIRSK